MAIVITANSLLVAMNGPDRVFYKWGGGVGPNFPEIADAYDEFLVT